MGTPGLLLVFMKAIVLLFNGLVSQLTPRYVIYRNISAKMATPACGEKRQEVWVCGAAEQKLRF